MMNNKSAKSLLPILQIHSYHNLQSVVARLQLVFVSCSLFYQELGIAWFYGELNAFRLVDDEGRFSFTSSNLQWICQTARTT
mmetsp:Transcript_784/g.1003  ORF Transcript_784/g.1003 Transcript_784/m.1003 type:complete len:82 (-) Transcript_784:162-407(-)